MHGFTIRIKPYVGESLFSFINRLGKKNGLGFLTICNLFKTSKADYFQNSEIGIINFAPFTHIDVSKLSRAVGLDEDCILKTTLFFSIYEFCEDSEVERARFISGFLNDKFRYCSCCLKEKNYHRILWSINNIEICIKHQKRLEHKCIKCNKILYFKDMSTLNICPHCGASLSSILNNEEVHNEILKFQIWVTDAWEKLIFHKYYRLKSDEVALRVLYILNNYEVIFSRNIIKGKIETHKKIETLLQHARNSLTKKRMMHFSLLFQILYEYNVSMGEFMSLKLPSEFIKSVKVHYVSKKEKVSCLAPWCVNCNVEGKLIKTGTTYKRKSSDKELLYYLVCPECGCEYAFDNEGSFLERTYFIKFYKKLINIWNNELGLTEIAYIANLSLDKAKRCLAYFNVRGIFLANDSSNNRFKLNEKHLKNFIEAIKCNNSIKDIEKWDCWESYREFLFYRFHAKVMKSMTRKRTYRKQFSCVHEKLTHLHKIINCMKVESIDINIREVCQRIGASPETIRIWGGNSLISQAKEEQKLKKLKEKRDTIYSTIEDYLKMHESEYLRSKDIYKHIGVIRNILWRDYPDITKFISKVILERNKSLENS